MKREQNKEQKRAAILAAARRVFLSQGYIGASMDHIAAEAGVTKQTVYRYFPSKEALFLAMLRFGRGDGPAPFLAELDGEDTRAALERFALGFIETHLSENHLATLRLLVAEGPEAPELARSFYVYGPKETETRLGAFLEERFGLENPEFETRMLINMLQSQRMGVLTGATPKPGKGDMEKHAKRTVGLFLRAFAPKHRS
jgi:AcrR family transcriptional regulator